MCDAGSSPTKTKARPVAISHPPIETFHFFLDLLLNFLGDGFAVYDRGHALLHAETENLSAPDKIAL